MKSKNNEKSIFDINFLMAQDNIAHTIKDIELVSQNSSKHVLSRNIDIETNHTSKNNMVELIKTGYNLPEADTPENMLCNSLDEKEQINEKNGKHDAFKIINLVSAHYNLPKIDEDNKLK